MYDVHLIWIATIWQRRMWGGQCHYFQIEWFSLHSVCVCVCDLTPSLSCSRSLSITLVHVFICEWCTMCTGVMCACLNGFRTVRLCRTPISPVIECIYAGGFCHMCSLIFAHMHHGIQWIFHFVCASPCSMALRCCRLSTHSQFPSIDVFFGISRYMYVHRNICICGMCFHIHARA